MPYSIITVLKPSLSPRQGAVRVLKEFARDLTDSQIPRVAPVILPDMYRIFMEQDKYGVRTRTRAIEIFTTMASMICTMGESNKGRRLFGRLGLIFQACQINLDQPTHLLD